MASLLGLAGGGAGIALLSRHKTEAEADLARAQVENMTWDHAKHTIVLLQQQVETLVNDIAVMRATLAERETDMIVLQANQDACEGREADLIKRLSDIESRLAKQEGTV